MSLTLIILIKTLALGHPAHRSPYFGIEAMLTTEPWKVFFNPAGCSWFNSAETLIGIVKSQVQKAFALCPHDISQVDAYHEFLHEQLQLIASKYSRSNIMHSCVPELQKAIKQYQNQSSNQ